MKQLYRFIMNKTAPCVDKLQIAVQRQKDAVAELGRVCDRHTCKMDNKGLQLVAARKR